MTQLIPALVFVAVLGAFMSTYLFRAARRSHVRAVLWRRLGMRENESSLLRSDVVEPSQLDRLVAESGLGWSKGKFIGRMLGSASLGALVGIVMGNATVAVLLALGGLATLPIIANRARSRRLALCDRQIPQALEIMALALRAGHPLPTALAIAASEAPSPICDEISRATDEHELGRPIGDVLVSFGKRLVGSEAAHAFVVAVLVLQQTGGNLITVIERIVENARARSHYEARLRALTAEGRSSARIMAFLPVGFGLLAAMIDPSYARTLVGTSSGNMVLLACVALWLIGLLWTRRLVRPAV
ncbi:MAG: type II secretion system F family protein [Deltaproteobacteria bacterium]|nr:type II secretion system F family protein [Deltaproteobacteria bacterium]